ncbi:Tfp pilus assembly protein FimT/FimU [Psychrobacter piscatorii]|nr:prepilin-type N-terminal cleavage/methylation domain-containing protein [Psychrobacter piscatorii]
MNASMNSLPTSLRTANSGFTLIELMVTIAVLAIIVSIAAPNISTQLANQRVKSTTAILANALKEAKIESRILRQPLTLVYNDNTKVINIQNIVPNKSATTIASYKYDAKISIKSATTSSQFRPNKTADATMYNICDNKNAASPRQIEVNNIGSIVIKVGGVCT